MIIQLKSVLVPDIKRLNWTNWILTFDRSHHYFNALSVARIFAGPRPRVPFRVRFYGRSGHNNKAEDINAGFLIVRTPGVRVFSRYFWCLPWRGRPREAKKKARMHRVLRRRLSRLASYVRRVIFQKVWTVSSWQVYDHHSWQESRPYTRLWKLGYERI